MLEEHLYVLGVLEDQRDIVISLVVWIAAHVPGGHGAAVDRLPTGLEAIIGNCPANATFSLFVHDWPRLAHGRFPVLENLNF